MIASKVRMQLLHTCVRGCMHAMCKHKTRVSFSIITNVCFAFGISSFLYIFYNFTREYNILKPTVPYLPQILGSFWGNKEQKA